MPFQITLVHTARIMVAPVDLSGNTYSRAPLTSSMRMIHWQSKVKPVKVKAVKDKLIKGPKPSRSKSSRQFP